MTGRCFCFAHLMRTQLFMNIKFYFQLQRRSKTKQNRAKKKNDGENINFLYTVSSIILAERQKSMDFLFYLFTGMDSMFIV